MKNLIFTLSLILFFLGNAFSQTFEVTFRVDMNAETVSPLGVHIAGSFQSIAGLGNNWDPSSTLMHDPDGDKIFELTVSLPAGTYEYKFINGNAWGMDENPPSECSIGSTNNRELIVTNEDIVLAAVPFNGCISKLKLAINMSNQTVAPEGVHVMGNFQEIAGFGQNWNPSTTRMQDINKDGTYEIELIIPHGNYQFVFVNGNTLLQAEQLSGSCSITGEIGSKVRAVTFDTSFIEQKVFCFNTCEECHPSVVYTYETKWWNDAVFYEIFVRSFYDQTGNGIGDFKGLTQKLDYLNDGDPETNDDLGITGIWLMPMMTSPSYHGYDVIDYYTTEPDYGSMLDFEEFLAAAHERGIKVIIDLVMNHSSNQNPWFIKSAANQEGYRNWYIWSDNNPGFLGPWGQNVWHQRNGDYYYGLFFDGMPDLNYTHQPVRDKMFDVVKFWLDKGVDGYRLDAIKYLIEDGTLLENTTQTFELLEEFHDVYKAENPDAFTVGEVWSSTQSIIPYVQNDRLDVCFEFGLAGAIIDAVDNANPETLENQLTTVLNSYPILQYATFLTNHDIDRVFSTLGAAVDKMKLAASIYLTLPGVPFVYYGEEIGMIGTGDHLNIRRPMQWADETHAGFSTVTPWQAIASNYHVNNVEEMEANPTSLLSHYKDLIAIRNEQEALRRGHTLLIENNIEDIFSFARIHNDEGIIVVSNTGTNTVSPELSLDLSALPAGEYFITELMKNEAFGKVTINALGGFSDLQISDQSLASRQSWILLLSVEDPTTGTTEIFSNAKILLTPNPAQDYFQIDFTDNFEGNMQVSIFSADSKLIYTDIISSATTPIDTDTWGDGVYFIHLTNGREYLVERLVVVRGK